MSLEDSTTGGHIDEVNLRRCVSELQERSKYLSARNSLAAPRDSTIIDALLDNHNNKDDAVATLQDSEEQHFITVIEVNENKEEIQAANVTVKATDEQQQPTTPTKSEVMVETKQQQQVTVTEAAPIHTPTITKPVAASRSRYENVVIETRKTSQESIRLTEEPGTPSATSTFTGGGGGSVLATAAIFNNSNNNNTAASNNHHSSNDGLRKKIPPRPPPKYAGRRAAAIPSVPVPVSSPKSKELKSSSLERNLKPSDLFRQGSSDSLDIISEQRRSEFEPGKLLKSDSRSSVSSSNTPHEGRDDKSSSSGSKEIRPASKTGSKESIGSIELTEKAKSYGSLSSLNSDGLKTSAQSHGGGGGDQEHHYDTVPIDNGEGDYVYIQPNAHSPGNLVGSLPLSSPSVQRYTSSTIEPDSPGRDSNYVNIDYFLQ